MSVVTRFVVPLAAVLVLAGCGPVTTVPPEASAPLMATQQETRGVEASSTPGVTQPATPLGLPAGMPLPPGSQEIAPPVGFIAAWTSDADPPQVYGYYLEALAGAGFSIDDAVPGGEAAIIRFTSLDGTSYQLDMTGHAPVAIALGPPHD